MYKIGRSAKEEKAVVYVEGVLGMIPGVLVAYVCWFIMGALKMYILPSIPHCFLDAWKDVEPWYMWYCGLPMLGAGVGLDLFPVRVLESLSGADTAWVSNVTPILADTASVDIVLMECDKLGADTAGDVKVHTVVGSFGKSSVSSRADTASDCIEMLRDMSDADSELVIS